MGKTFFIERDVMKFLTISITISLLFIIGCSGGMGDAVQPCQDMARNTGNHSLWGLWQFTADPVAETLDVVSLRSGEMHVNVLPFLEPPPFLNLTLESLEFNGDIIEADIGLRHPFLGLTEFTGFDVCGILISNGSISGFEDSDLVMAGGDDTYLMNPDGLTRWWNPSEFPNDGTMFGYTDGLLGTPDSFAGFNCTVNGYKFFCDSLDDPDDDVGVLSPTDRAMFSAGTQNVRHYTIHIGTDGLVFNYATDASWEFPQDEPPWEAPEDFGPGANRPEAWNISVAELSNTLFNDGSASGGGLSLLIDVWDHFDADLNSVTLESPGNFLPVSSAMASGGGEGYSTYQLDVTDAAPGEGSIDILVGVECEAEDYGGLLPGENVTAYFIHTADVSTTGFIVTQPNGGEEWDSYSHENITWVSPASVDFVDIYYSKDNFVSDSNEIATDYANTGTYDWYVPNDPSTTVKVKVVESDGALEDSSDDYFTILEGACDFGATGFSLAQNYFNIQDTYTHAGVFCSKQDPTQRLFTRNYYNPSVGNNGGTIFVFNASNPLGGTVAEYDTGYPMYTNNPEAMWIDSVSEPGIDRIIYHPNNGDVPTSGFRRVDWNGSAFVNHQTLPYSTFGVWRCCLKPNGDFVVMNVSYGVMYFWLHSKASNYAVTTLFQIDPAVSLPGADHGAWVQKMAYDPAINALLLLYNDHGSPGSGALYAVNADTGVLVTYDGEVFGSPNVADIGLGLNVDFDSPGCRVVVYGSPYGYSDTAAWIVRYSGTLDEKRNYTLPGFSWGLCNGDLQVDGTLWASPDNNYSRFFKFTPPPDW